jgi:hypothetical protein
MQNNEETLTQKNKIKIKMMLQKSLDREIQLKLESFQQAWHQYQIITSRTHL